MNFRTSTEVIKTIRTQSTGRGALFSTCFIGVDRMYKIYKSNKTTTLHVLVCNLSYDQYTNHNICSLGAYEIDNFILSSSVIIAIYFLL